MAFSSKTLVLVVALLGASLLQANGFDHSCDHDHVEQNPQFADIQEDMSSLQEGRVLASYSNIRIHAYFDFLRSSASSSYAAYIEKELVPPAVDYFESALRVKYPVVGNLVLGSDVDTICEHSTPSILKKGGVAADFFIYFDSEGGSGSQIANSKYCYLASGTKRPLVARTLINRNMMKVTSDVLEHEKNMYTIMHEMMHTLGFSTSLYEYFIDSNGNTRKGHLKNVKIGGSSRNVIDVSPLTERLRNFYGCSSLQGAVLENGGGSGTSASHFERRYFVYEAMSSGSIAGRKISEFSLALLEGSGWYVPDYDYAEPYFYGQGQGCSFVTGSCGSSSNFDEYCTGSSKGCAAHGRGGGYCSSDSITDGCKYYAPNQDYDCENDDGEDNARLPELQAYGRGAGSKCFTGDLNTRKSSNGRTSFCFKYTCNGSGSSTELQVQVGGNKITCTKKGSMAIDGYYGSIDCPDPLTFCNTIGKKYCPRNCMGRGSCVNGKCECRSGYSGVDCAL